MRGADRKLSTSVPCVTSMFALQVIRLVCKSGTKTQSTSNHEDNVIVEENGDEEGGKQDCGEEKYGEEEDGEDVNRSNQ